MHGVSSLRTQTPPPTELLNSLSASHFAIQPRSPEYQDTDSHYRDPVHDTDVGPGLVDPSLHAAPLSAAKLQLKSKPTSDSLPDVGLLFVPGFEIETVLGRGGMGTVYLARQLSLDRPVALKVMSRRWASDPTFVARFTREAYAAARLNHPNLVQVYDIGDVESRRYFSMEYVEGRSLADVVRAAGKLDPETAVGYILQAARGLKHAHDRGMIHRDIKPDNLLLDLQGIVKVADLGLVKTPNLTREEDSGEWGFEDKTGLKGLPANMTGARMALGTPAYMSPEQCRDAAAVDHRADIYSLGCTLYAMVTGQQPFDGKTAVELMTKHAYSPLVPPEEVASRVPRELSNVIQKMMAKQAGERYQTMREVVRVLEQWLGIQHHGGGRLAAGEEQIATLERSVDQFNLAPTAVLRTKLLTGFISTCVLTAVMMTFVGRLGWAFGLAGLIVQAAGFYFLLNGAARKTYLFRRVKQVSSGCSIGDWLVAFAMLALFAILLWMLKLFWMWVGFGLIAAAFAVALRYGLDRTVDAERRASLADCEKLLRRLRVQGLDEDQLRLFVARYAGRNWEEFFEALFGYEAKIDARNRLLRGESAGQRERFAGWREPIVGVLDRIERARRAKQERSVLVKVEQERLIATGLTPRAARYRAEDAAEAILDQAAAYHSAEGVRKAKALSACDLSKIGTSREVPNLEKLLAEQPAKPVVPMAPLQKVFGVLVGPVVRGMLAIVCLSACGIWAFQNNVMTDGARSAAESVTNAEPMTRLETQPLFIDGIPVEWTSWVDNANVGLAGILLLTSLLYTGERMGALVILGSLIAVVAHLFGIPAVDPIRDVHVGLMLGTVIALIGFRFGRR